MKSCISPIIAMFLALMLAQSAVAVTNLFSVTQIIRNTDGSVRVTWNSDTNILYDVYATENLATQSWRLVATQIPSQGTLTQWTDYGGQGRAHPADIKARFYRAALTLDSDGDGLPDAYELLVSNTATNLSDTNTNGVTDAEEDFDGDGVVNVDEYALMTSPYLADTDGDGVSDGPKNVGSITAGPDQFLDFLVKGKIRGDNQVGPASQTLSLPFVVYLTNPDGTPVANGSNVTFTASKPAGTDATSLLTTNSDATGNNGFSGQARTFLTIGSETGTWKVVAHCGATNFEFHAEPVTAVSLQFTDSTFQTNNLGTDEVIGEVAHMRVTVSGASTNVPHVVGVKLTSDENASGIVVALTETAAGSGLFTGSAHTDKLKSSSVSILSIPSSSTNAAGGNAKDDGVAEYASADNATESGSDWNDSDAFDSGMESSGFTSRGRARVPAPVPSGRIIMTKTFMKAAGVRSMLVVLGSLVTTNFLENQADVFYYSGHGFHDANVLGLPPLAFGPGDVGGGEWKKDLEIMIFAGCSVLDVTNDKLSGPAKPGKAWAKTGPTYFLGYEGSAPGDAGGAPLTIIQTWHDEWDLTYSFGDPIPAWDTANRGSSAWNASALDCSVSPKVAWHYTGTFFHTWTSVPESSW
jgi:hypothetical protein